MPQPSKFDFLEHLLLSGLTFGHYAIDLHDALSRARRGNLTFKEYRKLWNIGKALLHNQNWARPPSGYFDKLGVLFPLEGCLDNFQAMRKRLLFMIDFQMRTENVRVLVRNFNAILSDGPGPSRVLDLDRLSSDLVALYRTYPVPVFNLVTGRKVGADAAAGSSLEKDQRWKLARRDMTIVWLLCDLQVIAYRLMCAEHHALEDDTSAGLKLGGVGDLISVLWEMANIAMNDHAAGKSGEEANARFVRWCRANNIEAIGLRNEQHLRSIGQLVEGDDRVEDIKCYLRRLRRLVYRIHKGFKLSETEQMAGAATDARRILGRPVVSQEAYGRKKRVWLHDVATERFGAPSLVMLLVAILAARDVLGKLKHPAQPGAKSTAEYPLATPHKLARMDHLLFEYFRLVVVRDRRTMSRNVISGEAFPHVNERKKDTGYRGPIVLQEQLEVTEAGIRYSRIRGDLLGDARKIRQAMGQPKKMLRYTQIPWIRQQVKGLQRK